MDFGKVQKLKIKVNKCPFCGSDHITVISGMMNTLMFECSDCGADVCFYGAEFDQDKAVNKWNSRAGNGKFEA